MKRHMTICVVALLALAGCGGSSNSSSSTSASSTPAASGGGGGAQVALQADAQQLKFDTTKLTAKAGKVTIRMTNQSSLQHDIALKGGVDVKGKVVGKGGTSVITTTLKPGKYTFYCSVPGHEAAGMTGELDVN
jgi:plastocyanin